jgi:RNA polymerase sigma factor (sigma-70 family)
MNNNKFKKYYDDYFDRIYRFIYYKTQHKETAEDLTSTVFTKAYDNLDKYDPSKSSFSTWLYRIARNSVIDHYRTKKHNIDILDVWDLRTDYDIERDFKNQSILDEVMEAMEDINKEHREIIIMRLWDNLSYAEIAQIIGKSETNCRMIFSRSIGKLKKEIVISLIMFLIV